MNLYNEIMNEERKGIIIPIKSEKAEPALTPLKSFTESGFNKLPPPKKSRTDISKPECKRFENNGQRKYQGRCDYIKLVKLHFGYKPFDTRDMKSLGNFAKATPSQLVQSGHLVCIKLRKGGTPDSRISLMQWTGKEWTFREHTTVGSPIKKE